jgi:hypothetical protein
MLLCLGRHPDGGIWAELQGEEHIVEHRYVIYLLVWNRGTLYFKVAPAVCRYNG